MVHDPPRRFVHAGAARAQFGPAVDTLASLLRAGDPLADRLIEATRHLPPRALHGMIDQAIQGGVGSVPDAPRELVALFEELEHVPAWVDKAALERGGELLFRSGWFGGLALGVSLLLGFASPGGNKPLVFSGRLEEQAPRRLIETSRFVEATCRPNGLTRDQPGFAITVKVRIMHAHVRRMILGSTRWSIDDWGVPVNQHDMGGTSVLFSVAVIETLTRFGFELDEEEKHLFVQLWRYSGYLMGVHSEILPTSYLEGRRLGEIIASTEQGPDDDSRRLSRAFFASGENPQRETEAERKKALRLFRVAQGLMRGALGEDLADHLDVPKHRFRHVFPVARAGVSRVEGATRHLPAFARQEVRRRAIAGGKAYWDMVVRAAGEPLTFAPPDGLLGLNRELASVTTRRGATLASVARSR